MLITSRNCQKYSYQYNIINSPGLNKKKLYVCPFFPQICCPRRPVTKSSDLPDCTEEDYDENGDFKEGVYCEYSQDDEAEFEAFQYKSPEECQQNSTCTIKSLCGIKGMYLKLF